MLEMQHLADLAAKHGPQTQCRVREFAVGGRFLAFNTRPAIMGVVNLSPDSWYRESVCLTADRAVQRGKVLFAQGADVVDLGAESSLAHAGRLDETLQANRLLPVIKGLRESGIPVSVETYQPRVARECLEGGASVLNLTGTTATGEMYRMAAAHDAAVIICYVEGPNVRDVADFTLGPDPVAMMHEYFARQVEIARSIGLHKIILDPGLGFYYANLQDSALRVRHQMRVFLNNFRLRTLGCPTCNALPHAFEYFGEEVRCAEPFFAVLAALGRTDMFRTHEVPRVKAVLDTLNVY